MSVAGPRILISTWYENALLREVIHGIVAYARQHTPWQLVCHVNATAAELQKIAPAGMLVMTGPETEVHRWSQLTNTPLVMLLADFNYPQASRVFSDEEAIGEMAVDHFAGLGLKHLAYVGYGHWAFVQHRFHGFAAAAASRGYGAVPQLIGDLEDPERRIQFTREIKALLERLPRPCGLLAVNDILGVIIVQACRDVGLRVPEDIAVLGVDNDHVVCELSEVPLSSVVLPMFTIGYEAARILHGQIVSKTNQRTLLAVPPTRVAARASTDLIAADDQDVAAALRLIKDHFAEPINVTWVVEQLPVSRRSLYGRFLKVVGRTVLQQIHHTRLEKAKELLAESDLSMDVVARRSGLLNQAWLTYSFRRDLKTTPTRFRRRFRIES